MKATTSNRNTRIIRPDRCSQCRTKGPVEGHHSDYARPLDVEWLCFSCHRRLRHPARPKKPKAPRAALPREHFVMMGKIGGLTGGVKAAANMTPAQRTARARRAALARWR